MAFRHERLPGPRLDGFQVNTVMTEFDCQWQYEWWPRTDRVGAFLETNQGWLGTSKLISNHSADYGLVIIIDARGGLLPPPRTPRDRW